MTSKIYKQDSVPKPFIASKQVKYKINQFSGQYQCEIFLK